MCHVLRDPGAAGLIMQRVRAARPTIKSTADRSGITPHVAKDPWTSITSSYADEERHFCVRCYRVAFRLYIYYLAMRNQYPTRRLPVHVRINEITVYIYTLQSTLIMFSYFSISVTNISSTSIASNISVIYTYDNWINAFNNLVTCSVNNLNMADTREIQISPPHSNVNTITAWFICLLESFTNKKYVLWNAGICPIALKVGHVTPAKVT